MGKYIRDSELINKNFHCRYINLSTSTALNEIGKNSIDKARRFFKILIQTLSQMIFFKPQLCYLTLSSFGKGFYKDAVVVLLVKIFGVKLVYHFHNKGVSTRQHRLWDNLLYWWVFKNAEVILLSGLLYPDVQKYVPRDRVHCCPNGIPDFDSYINSKKRNFPGKKTEILFLSNLIKSKGVFVLLEACKILNDKQIPFYCTFVGGEGDVSKDKFQERVQEFGLNNCVHYAGSKYGQEKNIVFNQADIFVFPTYYACECFPLVILEAMRFAMPVISTFEGGIPDIVDNGITGFLVPCNDVKALALKIELLIVNPEMGRSMGAKGRAKFEKYYTLDVFENRFKRILDMAARQPS